MQRIKSSYMMLICAICTLVLFVSGVFAAIVANTSKLKIKTEFGPGIEGIVKLSTSTTNYQFSPDGETCFLPENTDPDEVGYGSKLLFDNVSETTTQPTSNVLVAPINGSNFQFTTLMPLTYGHINAATVSYTYEKSDENSDENSGENSGENSEYEYKATEKSLAVDTRVDFVNEYNPDDTYTLVRFEYSDKVYFEYVPTENITPFQDKYRDPSVFVAYIYIENHTTAFAVNVVVTATADAGVTVDVAYNSEEDAYADDDATYDGTGFQLANATATAPSTTIVAVKFIKTTPPETTPVATPITFNASISISLTEVQKLSKQT